MRYLFPKAWWAALAALAVELSVAGARADALPGLALDRFEPAPAGDRMFGVQSPFVAGRLSPHLMVLADEARNPLSASTETGGKDLGAIVDNQLFLRLNGSIALWDRVNVNVDVPLAVQQSGESPTVGGQAYPAPASTELGDVRLGLRLALFGEYDDCLQLAVSGYVWLPTGAAGSFVSDEGVRAAPALVLGGRSDVLVWSINAGPDFRSSPAYPRVTDGTSLAWGAGLGFLLGRDKHLQLGAETFGSVVLSTMSAQTTNAEVLVDGRVRLVNDVEMGLGVGPGLTQGAGTPDLRGVLMIAYTPERTAAPAPERPPADADRDEDGISDARDACPALRGAASDDPGEHGCPPPRDRDEDGIADARDACPRAPGVESDDPKKNGCPPPRDADKDGIADAEDACPDVRGAASDDPEKSGCPADRDGDGVPDERDACPAIKGAATADPRSNGCPGDDDRDTIRNDQDACPNERGPRDPDPEKNGCPRSVRVTDGEIVILQQVQFDTDKATIKRVSDGLLDEVASVLKQHPEFALIEVQGHTDDRGARQHNATLSQARAGAVRAAMTARGVDGGRLNAKGYGQEVPVDTNETDAGRQRNRRVQLVIVKKIVKDSEGAP